MNPQDRPLRRDEQQRATRVALLDAARAVFSQQGYHGATLAAIARHAGYSKGAVYSNFANKAELFLAVMDQDIARLDDFPTWDPFAPHGLITHGDGERADAHRGWALATLEFIAAAARDADLAGELTARVEQLLDRYTRSVRTAQGTHDHLKEKELAALLAALDQGIGLLVMTGVSSIDATVMNEGLRRLTDPARAATEPTQARQTPSESS